MERPRVGMLSSSGANAHRCPVKSEARLSPMRWITRLSKHLLPIGSKKQQGNQFATELLFRSTWQNGDFGLATNEERKLLMTVRINEPAQRGNPCVPTRPRSGGLMFAGRTVGGR